MEFSEKREVVRHILNCHALEQFTIPYSHSTPSVIPAKAGIQVSRLWMPDHVRHDERVAVWI